MSTQPLDALAVANEKRIGMARFRQELRDLPAGEARAMLADRLESFSGEDVFGACDSARLIACIHRIGVGKARLFLRKADVLPGKRVRELTPRQRLALAELLRNPRLVMPCWVDRG